MILHQTQLKKKKEGMSETIQNKLLASMLDDYMKTTLNWLPNITRYSIIAIVTAS